jgi:hypothetical protein
MMPTLISKNWPQKSLVCEWYFRDHPETYKKLALPTIKHEIMEEERWSLSLQTRHIKN